MQWCDIRRIAYMHGYVFPAACTNIRPLGHDLFAGWKCGIVFLFVGVENSMTSFEHSRKRRYFFFYLNLLTFLVFVACVYGFLRVELDHLQNPGLLVVWTSSTEFQCSVDLFIVQSMAIRKSSGDSKQLCRTPVPIWKPSETCPLKMTWPVKPSYMFFIRVTNFVGKP